MIAESNAITIAFQIAGYALGAAFLGVTLFGVLFSLLQTVRRAGVFPLGLRYASSRMINFVSVLGVAIGVAAVIVVISVMNGFISEQRKMIRGSLADLTVQPLPVYSETGTRPKMPARFEAYKKVLEGCPHVKAVAPRFVWAAMVFPPEVLNKFALARSGSDFIVQVIGIDPAAESKVSEFRRWITPIDRNDPNVTEEDLITFEAVADPENPLVKITRRDSLPKEAIIVGVSLARSIRLRKGTRVELVTLSPAGEISSQALKDSQSTPNMLFDVAGMFHTREQDFDLHNAFVSIPAIQKLLSEPDSDFTEIVVKLDDYNNADAAKLEIGRRLRAAGLIQARRLQARDNPTVEMELQSYGSEIRTWEEQKGNLLRAIENERGILGFIVFVVVVVAAFIQFAILSMMVTEKTRDVGILATLGASGGEILAVFVDVGIAMTVAGSALGLGIALLVTANLNKIDEAIGVITGQRIFNPDIYFFKSIPSEVDPVQVAWILGMTLASGVIASLVPAWRAARFHPARALRHE